jgi:hypothetical protein
MTLHRVSDKSIILTLVLAAVAMIDMKVDDAKRNGPKFLGKWSAFIRLVRLFILLYSNRTREDEINMDQKIEVARIRCWQRVFPFESRLK